ncbi:mitochondrial folylpolyglutamate synthase, partial [Tribonema minus]
MTAVGAAPITFTAAVDIVNNAISTGAALEAAAAQRKQTVEAMHHYLGPTRLNLDISGLKVVHVTGTKGKGSTCCFVESILQHYGVATGLFTSPHLQKMTERIRVGGRPISEQAFSTYTYEVWEKLKATESAVEGTGHARMPTFFRLLTLIGLWTFVHERHLLVDTVILEVGIGGRYDATNVVPPPIACGVTTLDYDHTAILGATLPEIAWEKGGIFKPGSRCFSTLQTCDKATDVLRQCAADAAEQLTIVPALEAGVKLGLDGADHQRLNAALAVTLCACALKRDAQTLLTSQEVSNACIGEDLMCTQAALAAATWPGRCQVVQRQGANFFIDGAHTAASVRTAAAWFAHECAQRSAAAPGRPQRRHLIFNCSHERDAIALLMPLLQL